MSAIGRVTASALAAMNENTFGLANFNIDFSLVKVEAPIEYRGLRSALSRHRVENAEQGPQHRTARRLGALFEQILTPIKTLAEAYGRRASQIAETAKQDSPVSSRNGPFAQHTGLDGTSIYAAATSGSSAIAVHLLACLLARTWSGPEAIAIWVELVAERKRDINENTDASQIQGLAARVAAQQEISRADLAMWDASARAWLLSADEIKKFNLTQLRLIIKDSGLLVSSFGATYDSVIDVWITAMNTLQDLILGRPQRISKGALLIGLSCWHIFPDLNVVGPLIHVNFNDELVDEGGVVTLGLQSASPDNDPGVQWSLSLSHLRYYGNPVTVTSRTSALGSRISMEDLHMVALGAVFGAWRQCFTDPFAGARLIAALRSCQSTLTDEELELRFPAMHLLSSTARRLLKCSCETERRSILCLIAYGRRRGHKFLLKPSHKLEPAFGLADPKTLWRIVSDNKGEGAITRAQEIDNIRKFAELCGFASDYGIIRYPRTESACHSMSPPNRYAYTTVIPYSKNSQKRDLTGQMKNTQSHTYWVALASSSALTLLETFEVPCQSGHLMQSGSMLQEGEIPADTYADVSNFKWINPPKPFDNLLVPIAKNQYHWELSEKELSTDEPHDEEPSDHEPFDDDNDGDEQQKSVRFHRSFGYRDGATLFFANTRSRSLQDWEIHNVLETLNPGPLSPSYMYAHFGVQDYRGPDDGRRKGYYMYIMSRSLSRLVRAASMYRRLPGATISISVVNIPIYDNWFTNNDLYHSLAAKFACIAMFETGTCSIQAEQLGSVMAMSSGNSIYVADALLQDPINPNTMGPQGITRIIGNIDHPGVVMLAPPQSPLIRSDDADTWRVVNHQRFDGKLENCLSGTSLHLSFTKYEVPLSVSVGAVDAEISMVETLISAHDLKNWVADLDILSGLRCEKSFKRLRSPYCIHENQNPRPPTENAAVQIGKACDKQLVSIASWAELLDPPGDLGRSTIAVVRAYDNWHARVATMSVCVQMGLSTGVLPTEPLCTICGNKTFVDMAKWAQVLIF
ncbi:MAG: hypothetical protein L6R42_004959 [Xanthoria sp. 1 TBL-2021]|nr:MAG: hypothetical protein L6R42_004959 [Xanthoria sp. 1 TBL-2021]